MLYIINSYSYFLYLDISLIYIITITYYWCTLCKSHALYVIYKNSGYFGDLFTDLRCHWLEVYICILRFCVYCFLFYVYSSHFGPLEGDSHGNDVVVCPWPPTHRWQWNISLWSSRAFVLELLQYLEWTVMLSTCSNIQSHTDVLPVPKG